MHTNTRGAAFADSLQLLTELRRLKPHSPVLSYFTLEHAGDVSPAAAQPLSVGHPARSSTYDREGRAPRAQSPDVVRRPPPASGTGRVDDELAADIARGVVRGLFR
jgi:hypothetical protein